MNAHDHRIDPSLFNLDSGIFHGLPAPAVPLDTFHLDTYAEPAALQPLPPLVRRDLDTLRPASLDDVDVVVEAPRRSSAWVAGVAAAAGVALALGGVALVRGTEAAKVDHAPPARAAAVPAPAPQPVAEASKPEARASAAPADAVPPASRGFRPSAIRLTEPAAPLAAEAPRLVERYAETPSPAAGPTAELDRAAVTAAVARAGQRAASCRPDRGTMIFPVTLLYATSGRVTAARVNGGPFVGTSVGACVALALRGAAVPAFAGEPVTVHTTVRLP